MPYRHAVRYRGTTIVADKIALHEHVRVERHGHCNFTADEILGAFATLVSMVEGLPEYRSVSRVFLPSVVNAH